MAAINNDVDRPDPAQTGEAAENNTDEAAWYGFLQRRLDQTCLDLDAAQQKIVSMARQIRDLEIGRPPPEAEHGMAMRTAHMRPLQVEVAGRTLTLAIPARGIQTPAIRRHIWRTLHERYGSQEQ